MTKRHFEISICFWFQWMSLGNFFLIKFWKFLVLYLGCGCMSFDFTIQMTSSHRFSAKPTKYIPKCWGRSLKRKSNLNFIKVIKKFWSKFSIYMVQTFPKTMWWKLLAPSSGRLLIGRATLSTFSRLCNRFVLLG